MSGIRIRFGKNRHEALLMAHRVFDGYVRFGLPECHGSIGGRQFAVHQLLSWHEVEPRRKAAFKLVGDAAGIGMDCHGSMSVIADDELSWEVTVRNLQQEVVDQAHHTVWLDMDGAPAFIDDYGDRTFLYTDAGWCPVRNLLDLSTRLGSAASFRVGAAYRGRTVMWKVIARVDTNMKHVFAIALDRACAFAVDHPSWSAGVLGSCRWGRLAPGEGQTATGRIYLLEDSLEALRARYIRDFKGGRA